MKESSKYIVCFSDFIKKNEEFKTVNLGSKFTNLALLHKEFNIPTGICVIAEFLNSQLELYINDLDLFVKCFKDIESTAGCYLLETYSEIEKQVAGFKMNEKKATFLKKYFQIIFGRHNTCKFAVRSSAAHEDSIESSFAGIYKTTLDVDNYNDIIICIENAVIEYYSYSAVVARIRENNFHPFIELNIFIQKMIASEISGVAFSSSPLANNNTYVEWIYGIGELIVSGEKEASSYYVGMNEQIDIDVKSVLDEVVLQTQNIREKLGYEVDVEWCYANNQIYILQARAITDSYVLNMKRGDVFEVDNLYYDSNIEFTNKLGQCKNIYYNYTSKRSPKYLLAKKNDIYSGQGYVIHFNVRGLKKNEKVLQKIFAGDYFEKVVIDVDDTIRQNIISKNRLFSYLMKLFGAYDENICHTIIVRQFIRGDYGCISHCLSNGSVFIEYSKDGLLCMNRGLADCQEILVPDGQEDEMVATELNEKSIKDIVKFTKVLHKFQDKYMIEWVICHGNAFFIDYSQEIDSSIENIEDAINNRIIMPGNIEGPIYSISEKRIMEKLSVSPGVSVNDTNDILLENPDLIQIINSIKDMERKPIVFIDKPYAILSFLFNYVEGFVFKQGSMLCHLSILLREHKIPSVICKNADEYQKKYHDAIIANGQIIGVE